MREILFVSNLSPGPFVLKLTKAHESCSQNGLHVDAVAISGFVQLKGAIALDHCLWLSSWVDE
jgi:hypothetical protein